VNESTFPPGHRGGPEPQPRYPFADPRQLHPEQVFGLADILGGLDPWTLTHEQLARVIEVADVAIVRESDGRLTLELPPHLPPGSGPPPWAFCPHCGQPQ
jgi:hypothetical protein